MILFLIKRFMQIIPVLWGVASLVFFLIHFIPGDPVDIMLGESALPASKEALREQLHLNEPLLQQYINFWKNLFHGDLGSSLLNKRNVADLLLERIPSTLALSFSAIFFAICIAIPIGVVAAVWQNSAFDRIIIFLSLFGVSMPNFWLGPILILFFSIHLGILPVSEQQGFLSYIMPTLTLGISLTTVLCRMTRASTIEVLRQDYITTARGKGLSEFSIYMKHALKNSIIPVITILGMQLGALLSGAVIIETIFDWPGLGDLLYRAIQSRDYPLVQGCILVIACIYLVANALADIAYSIANPRIRLEL